jgi:hypothetical protein
MHYIKIVFALIISGAAFFFSTKFILLYFKVKSWNRINAEVLSKEIYLHPKYSTTRTPYGIKATYRYAVDGSSYTGDKIYLIELAGGQANHMKHNAESKLKDISSNMSIYVNPDNPKESVLFCEGIGLYLFVFCAGFFSLLMALSFILMKK